MADDAAEPIVEAAQPSPVPRANVVIQRVEIRNFRGIAHCSLELEPDLTVLVGRNNSGKTRILRAIAIALGTQQALVDDLTVDGLQEATIDIVLRATLSPQDAAAPTTGAANELPFNKRTRQKIGARLYDLDDIEQFAWRTRISRSNSGVVMEHTVLTYDYNTSQLESSSSAQALSREQASVVAAELIDVRRDLHSELSQRGSSIGRLLSDLEIPAVTSADLESRVKLISDEIVTASPVLGAVQDALSDLSSSVDSIGSPEIQPIPPAIQEIARGVSIGLKETGSSAALPMRLHGSGARSLASLQIQGVLYERRMGTQDDSLAPHPVTLIEEPEAHLHPQAQFELESILTRISGQSVVSTHSTHLVTVVDPNSIRVLRAGGNDVEIVDFHVAHSPTSGQGRLRAADTHLDEVEKLRRMIERPFGEILFASAVVIGDGATERSLLPILMRVALGAAGRGVCVVDPGSMGTDMTSAVLKTADLLGIPWILFADSDADGKSAVARLVKERATAVKQSAAEAECARVAFVSAGRNTDEADSGCGTERMLIAFDEDLVAAVAVTLGYSGSSSQELLRFLKRKKGSTGAFLARALIENYPDPADWPPSICELIAKLRELLDVGTDHG